MLFSNASSEFSSLLQAARIEWPYPREHGRTICQQRIMEGSHLCSIFSLLRFLTALAVFFAVMLFFLTVLLVHQYPWHSATKNTHLLDFTRKPLSQQTFYTDHFAKHPNQTDLEAQQATHRLLDLVSSALATKPKRPPHAWPQKGYTFDKKFVDADYEQLSALVNELCEPSFVYRPKSAPHISPMCLSVFTNAFIGPSGIIYDPESNAIYDAAGGCCLFDWGRFTDEPIDLKPSPSRVPLVLSLGFHHAVTYHHVIHEFLPRLLPLFPLLDAEPELYIAIDESSVARRLLDVLGVNPSRILAINRTNPLWINGAIVLQPPPLSKCRNEWKCLEKSTKITTKVLRDAAIHSKSYQETKKLRPKLLLMERARSRAADGSCREQRCAKNFGELRRAIKKEFGGTFDIVLVPPELSVIETVRTFIDADVVVGLHGAGFQNMMYCSKGTTIVHVGWDNQYRNLAEEFGLNFHLSYMKSMTRNSRNLVVNVRKIVADVKKAIATDRAASNT